jgi:tetratricopeptide (TPR) repeat protein
MGWSSSTANDKDRCTALAHFALDNPAGDATLLAQCGVVFVLVSHEYERGMLTIERALETNPNNVDVLICAAVAHLHCGDIDMSLALSHRVMRLAPADPTGYFPLTAIAHAMMVQGDYAEALRWATRSYAVNDRFDATYWMLIAANAHLNQLRQAKSWLDMFRTTRPDVGVESIRRAQPTRYPDRMASILDGLRIAGLPEVAPL